MALEERIRRRAATLDFSACGFAAATPIERGAFLDGWLAAGFAAGMRHLERRPERRLAVTTVVPGARTVVSLAYPYGPPAAPVVDWPAELRGRVAAYAVADDYHQTVDRHLAELEAFIATECPTTHTRRYVDTGPVLEREWAVRGGLGWFGKNTTVVNCVTGSRFFLAELVTTVPLAADHPTISRCGDCTRCIDACPTGALREGLVLDARLCLSYLTIEHRASIPPALRSKLGPWVFGCDICQEACPWNDTRTPIARTEPTTPAPAAHRPPVRTYRGTTAVQDRRGSATSPYLPEILALDEASFRARFSRTPLARARRGGLLRNVAVALGNSRNADAVPPLKRALADPDALVRGHAAWALGAIGDHTARRVLERARRTETDQTVRIEISSALAECG